MARGPQPVPIDLSDDEREQLTSWARRRTSAAGLATRSRVVLAAAEGGSNTEIAARLELSRNTVARVAAAVLRGPPRRAGRRAAPGPAEVGLRRRGRGADHRDPREGSEQRHALVDPVDGRAPGDVAVHGVAGVAGLRAGPAQDRDLEAVERPAVHRQGPRHRRALPRPAGAGAGALRGREDPDPGARPHRTDLPDAARHPRAGQPRLRPPRHFSSLYAALAPRHRQGHRLAARTPSRGSSSASSCARSTPQVPDDLEVHPGARQRLDPQDPVDQTLARPPTRGSSCTSPRPAARGSTSSSAGSPS